MKIGCSLSTLYDLIQGGKLRSYHIGRAHIHLQRWLFRFASAGLQRSSSFPGPGL